MNTPIPSQWKNKRIILITGASRGIGRAVAQSMAHPDNHIILLARTISALEEVDDTIRANGGQATIMPCDLQKNDELDNLGPTILSHFGKLDVFISNAATLGPLSPIAHIDTKQWHKVLDVNLNSQFRLIRTLDPLLRLSAHGRAIFVTASIGNTVHPPYWAPYAVSKAGLQAIVNSYAAETKKTNLRVNMINPGIVQTNLLAQAYPGGYQGKAVTPDDVVAPFLELASEECTRHGECIQL